MFRHRSLVRLLVVVGMLAVAGLYRCLVPPRPPIPESADAPIDRSRADAYNDIAVEEAFKARRSGVWIESSGTVDRLLGDDRSGSPHQRFIVRLRGGRTLLFAHNLDLASRVPVEPGANLRFRGVYEWSERGGTVHWTHHHPEGKHEGGWIEHAGRRYR